MTLLMIMPLLITDGITATTLPYVIDALVTAAVTITALVLAILAYRNTKKILKKLEGMEK